jgi:chromosome segregation ATPase
LELKTELERAIKVHERHRKDKQKTVHDRVQQMKQAYSRAESLDKETQRMHEKLRNLREEEKERKKAIEELRAKLAKLEKEMDNPPQTENANEIMSQIVGRTGRSGYRALNEYDRNV